MVNTQTSISKKVLAVVLAVACMIAFTPAIAFTQSANADTASVAIGTINIDGSREGSQVTKLVSGSDTTSSTGSYDPATKTETWNLAGPVTGTVTVDAGYSLVINTTSSVTFTGDITCATTGNLTINGAGKVVGKITAGTTGKVAVNDTVTVAPTTGVAIDGSAITTGSISTAAGTTVNAGTVTDANGASAILFPVKSSAITGTLTVAGKVTGGDQNGSGTLGGYAVAFSSSVASSAVNFTRTGATMRGGMGDAAKQAATNLTDANIAGTVAVSASTAPIKVGTVMTATTTNVKSASYQWYRSTDNTIDSTDKAIDTATSSTYTVTKDDSAMYLFCEVTDAGLDGTAVSNVSTQVSAVVAAPTFTKFSPATQTVEAGDVVTDITATFANSTGATYKWYVNTSKSTTGGTEITASNMATYMINDSNLTDNVLDFSSSAITNLFPGYYFYCVATNSDASATATSDVATVAYGALAIATQPTGATYYMGDAAVKPLSVTFNGKAPAGGTWKYYTTDAKTTTDVAAVIDANDASKVTGTPVVTATGTYHYYYTVTKGSTVYTSNTVDVVVKAPTIKTQPKTAEYAVGDTADPLTYELNGVPTSASVAWYSNDVNSTKGGTALGAGNATPSTAAEGTMYYYAVISYTDTGATPTAQTLTTTPVAVKVVKAAIAKQPVDMTTVAGKDAEFSFEMNGVNEHRTDVTWKYSANADGTSPTTLGTNDSQSENYAAPADTGTYYYWAEYTDAAGNAAKTSVAKMTVVAADDASIITTQPVETKTVYVGQDAVLKCVSGMTGAEYDWNSNTTAVNVAGTYVSSGSNFAVPTDKAGTYYYYCNVYSSGGDLIGVSKVATVTVKDYPAVGTKFTSGAAKYKVTVAATAVAKGSVVVYAPAKNSSTKVTVPATVTKSSVTYNVVGIASKAFAKSKCKTLTIKSKMLTKAGVKNSLKGSKVTTVKVPSSKVKTYKKYFTKSNCGKKVTVKKY